MIESCVNRVVTELNAMLSLSFEGNLLYAIGEREEVVGEEGGEVKEDGFEETLCVRRASQEKERRDRIWSQEFEEPHTNEVGIVWVKGAEGLTGGGEDALQ